MQAVIEAFGESFIDRVNEMGGGLDMFTLFRNVATVPDPRTSAMDQGMTFLNSLAATDEDSPLNAEDEGSANEVEEVELPASPALPVALPNASARERAMIERVTLNGDRWEVVVVPGDTLAMYASALYSNALAYNVIFQANTDVMSNPNLLRVGLTLRLPKQP